jgi:hypothetical protein
MEVVEAQNVKEILFDAETGRPIRPIAEQTAVGGPTPSSTHSKPKASSSGSNSEAPPQIDIDLSKAAEEFPINFTDAHKK